MDRKHVEALRAQSVGIIHWSPPKELDRELDGSKYGGDRTGFQIRPWGTANGDAPRVKQTSLSLTEALAIARWQDRHLHYDPRRGGIINSEEWVKGIITALAQVLDTAVDRAREREAELRVLQATAQGMTVQLAAPLGHELEPDPQDIPF